MCIKVLLLSGKFDFRIQIDLMKYFLISVLPSFSGNVPAALRKIYPLSNITRLGNWYSLLLHLPCVFNAMVQALPL